MNKYLILVVLVLIPVTIVTYQEEDVKEVYAETLENQKVEVSLNNENTNINEEETQAQVLVSHNRDKSDAYYVDLEEYIIGVVAGEMPASFHMEALKAQAVAARTYALYKMENQANYVLSASVSDQVYLTLDQMKTKWGSDFDYYYNRVKEAVTATAGEVIKYHDELIIAYYFAISNGYTDDGAIVFNDQEDYLVSVDSSWDKNYASYASTRTMSKSSFCSGLNISCDDIVIQNVVRADNHYVRSICINGVTFTGREVFSKLGLKSHDFTITVHDNIVSILTYGFGHGVGMSQYGALGMANQGYSYQDILTYYYKNTQISHI